MNTTESLMIGILSGISATILVHLIILYFNKIFLPWYQDLTYKGIDISGRWTTKIEHELNIDDIVMDIKQIQQNITGEIIVLKHNKSNDEKEIKNLHLFGKIIDGYILLQSYNKDTKYQSFLTHLLKISNGGNQIKGQNTFVDAHNGEILSDEILYTRQTPNKT